jgi:toxin FitB
MILIDTRVVSELMRLEPDPRVLDWFGSYPASQLYLSAIGEAALRRGAAVLPEGRRRERLIEAIDAVVTDDFGGRILPFDSAAARAFAILTADRQRAGRPMIFADALIAATARANGAAIATRNIVDFEGCEVALINPWDAQGA